jgi:hypothetical protein
MQRTGKVVLAVVLASVGVVLGGPTGASAVTPPVFQAVEGAPLTGTVVPAPAGCVTAQSTDWGPGQTTSQGSCASGSTLNTGAHTYAEEGDYAAVANYNSPNGAKTSPFSVHVADAALSGTGTSFNAIARSSFTGTVAHFTDANPNGVSSDYAATIDWGDGTSSLASVGAAATGFNVTGSHAYSAAGTFPLSIVITDAVGGASTTVPSTAHVASASPPPPPPTARFTITPSAGAGAPLTLDASSTHAPGTLPVRGYAWQIAGANSGTDSCGAGTSKLKLFLPRSGAVAITLTVTDVAGHTSQLRQTTQVSGLQYQPKFHIPRGTINTVTPVGWCIPGLNDPPVDVSSNGGPPHGCNQTLNMFIVEAVGCFQEITNGRDIPAAEAAILDQQPQWTASGAHAIDGTVASVRSAQTALFKPQGVGQLSGPALAYFARPFLSHSEVRLNGIDYIPHNGASILIVPMLNLVISADATISLKDIPLGNGQIAEDVGDTHGQGYQVNANDYRVHVDDYQLSTFAKKIGVAGLPFDGQASVDFSFHRALVTAEITMPNFFSTDGGEPFNAKVVLHTDNNSGLELDQIALGPLNADVFGLKFTEVRFAYDATIDSWDAQGKLDLFGSVGLDATPDPPNPPEYGVHFSHGEFKSAGASASFGDAGIEIFPGVQLNKIGIAVSLNPTLFIGDVGLRALELAQIDGRVIVALPSEAAPYELTTGDAGPQFAQIAGHTFTGSPTIGVGGSLSLQVAGVDVPLANAYFLYSYPSYVAFGGNFQYGADDFGISGGVNGEFNVAADQFNVEGHVQINLPDPLPGFRGDAVVSSKGIAACGHGTIYTPFPITVTLGAGYHWGDGVVIWIRSCNLGEFVQHVQTSSAHAAAGTRSFTLPAGLPSAEVRIDGIGAAPNLTVRGPDGQTATTPASGIGAQGRFTLVRTPKLNATWIEIEHPPAGTYTVSTAAGSAAIGSLATADGLPPASVSGRIGGSGSHRVLRYSVRRRPGQLVTFLEGSHKLATVAGGKGSIRFTPGAGPLGTRTVVAQVTLAGLPNANVTVARFTVRRLPRLGRAGRLRVQRRGAVLRISWRAVSDARRYAVYVHGSDGQVHALTVTAARHSAVVRGIARVSAGTVTITAIRLRDHGPRASTRFRALSRLRTGVHRVGFRPHK